MARPENFSAPHPILQKGSADSIWNVDEERSLPNLISPNLKETIEETIKKAPEFFEMDEKSLRNALTTQKKRPVPLVGILRLKFWHEYDRAQGAKTTMTMANIYGGICFVEQFQFYMRDVYALSWILCPPIDYIAALEEGLVEGLAQMRAVLEEPVHDYKGRFNVKLAELQAKITMYFDQRRHGSIVQKIEQSTKSKSVAVTANVTVPASQEQLAKLMDTMSEEDMQAKLKELQEKKKPLNSIEMNPE